MKKIIISFVCVAVLVAGTATAFANTGMINFKKSQTYAGNSDVAANAWYQPYVKSAFEYDLVEGYEDGSFRPEGNITLAEAITVSARMYSIYASATADFDTSCSPWYKEIVNYAHRKDIIGKTTFADSLGSVDYTRPATKAEIAYLLSQTFPSSCYPVINSSYCKDVSASTSYYHSIFQMIQSGVITGDENGYFYPTNNVKRSEFVAMVARAVDSSLRK